ncbi:MULTISPECIES: nuclear transport factor 2 family protein [Sphingobium]|uniref:nuclear transport factor 2 family protein n=1 Tax=Sphingobium sp. MI1205 TaxID=407020 RepID=UPI0007700E62|nr:nuclear transport factor 2 family protein [Sphingobium sp. MI1205]AMK16882.1 hypothetical protein K663_02465 [Sphingobium sp. MI1205]
MTVDVAANLAIEHEIRTVLFRYCRSMDRIDAELGYSVWHDDGTADYGALFKGTGRGFVDWVCEFHRGLDATSHQLSNILVNPVSADEAYSETYVTVALLGATDNENTLTTGRGRYLDRWTRRDGRLALAHRDYIHDFAITQKIDEPMMGWGTRSTADPSYSLLGAIGAV